MPRAGFCTICEHPKRQMLDLALSQGTRSLNGLAKAFGVNRGALTIHRSAHLNAVELKSLQDDVMDTEVNNPQAVLSEFVWMYKKSKQLLAFCEKTEDKRGMKDSLTTGLGILDKIAKAYSMYSDETVVNVGTTSKTIAFLDSMPTDDLKKLLQRAESGQLIDVTPAEGKR